MANPPTRNILGFNGLGFPTNSLLLPSNLDQRNNLLLNQLNAASIPFSDSYDTFNQNKRLPIVPSNPFVQSPSTGVPSAFSGLSLGNLQSLGLISPPHNVLNISFNLAPNSINVMNVINPSNVVNPSMGQQVPDRLTPAAKESMQANNLGILNRNMASQGSQPSDLNMNSNPLNMFRENQGFKPYQGQSNRLPSTLKTLNNPVNNPPLSLHGLFKAPKDNKANNNPNNGPLGFQLYQK